MAALIVAQLQLTEVQLNKNYILVLDKKLTSAQKKVFVENLNQHLETDDKSYFQFIDSAGIYSVEYKLHGIVLSEFKPLDLTLDVSPKVYIYLSS